ncbi:MAG: hypothetical protein QXZ30_01470 [Candidatus Bilamarchaeaceae archaeon]
MYEGRGQNQRNLILIYVFWLIPIVFSSVWLIYFKEAGLSNLDISLAYIMWPLSALFTIFAFSFAPSLDKRALMGCGALSAMISYIIILFFPPSFPLLALSFFIYGFSVFLFWVPFNILYFRGAVNSAATSSTLYFSVSGLLSILLSVVGGLVLQRWGGFSFFLISALLFLPVVFLIFLLKEEQYKNNLNSCIKETKGFRTLNFLEGTTTGVLAGGTIVSLSLLDQPFYLGIFIAFVTIFSILASFFMSYLSDKTKKRKLYINIFSVMTSLSTILMFFYSNVITWAAFSGIRNFFSALFWPFTTAILVDNKRDLSLLMSGREIFLNVGRVFGISVVILSIYALGDVRFSFVFLGFLLLLYPFVLSFKKSKITVS